MNIKNADAKNLQDIFREEYGIKLTKQQADQLALLLFRYYNKLLEISMKIRILDNEPEKNNSRT